MYRIELPLLPSSMNLRERQSFWVRKKELDMISTAIGALAMAQDIPAAVGKRWVKVTIIKGKRSRVRDDPANRDSRAKSILDAMVNNGLLVDDSDRWLEWQHVIEAEREDAKRTIIEFGDCDDE